MKRFFKTKTIFAIIIFIAAITPYLSTLDFSFTYDDQYRIEGSSVVTDPEISLQSILAPLRTSSLPGDLYRPISELSYRINYLVLDETPASFRAVNIALHATAAALVFAIATGLGISSWAAITAALLFAVHPINNETVISISGRAEVLAAIFGMLACLALQSAFRRQASVASYLGACVLLLLASLSKESGLVFFALAPLYAAFGLASADRKKLLKKTLPFLTLAIASSLFLRYLVLEDSFFSSASQMKPSPLNPLWGESWHRSLLGALYLYGEYFLSILLPFDLLIDYSQMPIDFWAALKKNIWTNIGIVFLLATLGWFARQKPWGFFGLWYFLAFLLTINLLFPIGTIRADRLAYTPSIGVLIFTAGYLTDIARRYRAAQLLMSTILIGACVLFSLETTRRKSYWLNNMTLYRQMTLENDSNPKAHMNYGISLLHRANQPTGARIEFEKVLKIDANNALAKKYLTDSIAREEASN